MSGENFRDIHALLVITRERSFTRAAAELGVSQSALSHTIKGLEQRLGLRLLTRTTRSVSLTEAGERLSQAVAPRFDIIAQELAAFDQLRDRTAGTVRLCASDYAANTILWPKLRALQPAYPDLKLELAIDNGLVDIIGDRYDAGVRFGNQIDKDMRATAISAPIQMAIVGAPGYLARQPAPQTAQDLLLHNCINTRLSAHGGIAAWDLRHGERNLQVRVEGSWTFNGVYPALDAALAGCGLAYLPGDLAAPHIAGGRLVSVLAPWCPMVPGLHIYYANRLDVSPALSLVVDTLRHR
jgi:DNA-binding transcriptional LysR family regulator